MSACLSSCLFGWHETTVYMIASNFFKWNFRRIQGFFGGGGGENFGGITKTQVKLTLFLRRFYENVNSLRGKHKSWLYIYIYICVYIYIVNILRVYTNQHATTLSFMPISDHQATKRLLWKNVKSMNIYNKTIVSNSKHLWNFRRNFFVTEDCLWTNPAWYTALEICWYNASLVGGMFSIKCTFFAKSCFLHSLIEWVVLDLSYKRTTYLSKIETSSSLRFSMEVDSFMKHSVASGYTLQVSQAFIFPHRENEEMLLHPVNAYWNKIPSQYCLPMEFTISWIGYHLRFWPDPNSIHNSSILRSNWRDIAPAWI